MEGPSTCASIDAGSTSDDDDNDDNDDDDDNNNNDDDDTAKCGRASSGEGVSLPTREAIIILIKESSPSFSSSSSSL